MAPNKELCLKFCEELSEKFIIPEGILRYEVFSDEDCKDVTIKICAEEDKYNFIVNLIQNSENISNDMENINQYLGILTKNEDYCTAIRDVSISEYHLSELEVCDLPNLRYVLKSLAVKHAKSIKEHYITGPLDQMKTDLCRSGYKEMLCKSTAVVNLENIDQNMFEEGIENLVSLAGYKLDGNLIYVPSYPIQNRLVFKHNDEFGKCKIINTGHQMTVPLVYDVLMTIFHLSNQKLRQCHFHELIEYFYRTLENNLLNFHQTLSACLSFEEYENQIKCFLPLVKLDIAYQYCQKNQKYRNDNSRLLSNKNNAYDKLVEVAISELYECFQYPKLNREDCYQIIRNKIGSSKYKFMKWSMTQLIERPGFLGDYFKLKIKINVNDDIEDLNLFAKYLPTSNDIVKDLAEASFHKERYFYHTFVAELKSLGLEGLLDFFPACYFTRSNDVLVFEDLSQKNYKSLNKTESLSYDNMRLVIKQLVKLHACSILYEEKMSEKYGKPVRIDDKYSDYLKEVHLQIEEVNGTSKITICGIHTTLNYVLDAFPDIPKKMPMKTFKDKVSRAYDSLFSKVKKCNMFRNVICQGDFWTANILFKMKDDNTPVDCRIIDYQLIRYCPPTHDLLFLIYVNSDKETRIKYMDKLIEEYYLELSNIIEKYNVDMNKIYTYQQFLECCEYMKSAAICIASLYLPIVMCPVEKVQEILADEERATIAFSEDRKEMLEGIYHEGPYRQRNREIVEDLYDICESGSI